MVGYESLPGLLGCGYLCISTLIHLLELYSLLDVPKFLVEFYIEDFSFEFMGQKIG